MDLQPLFAAPIWEQSVLDPGYADHTNAVWRERTAAGVAVVRVPRVPAAPANPLLVVEHLPGQMWTSFQGQDPALLAMMGEALATVHARALPYCGDPGSRRRYPVTAFHRPLPDPAPWRCLYRYLCHLLDLNPFAEMYGSLDAWLASPARF